jgi:DNA polymerase-3 subunit gamma/tau
MEEKYIVSARKYRPSTFSSVVGQKTLTATLRNAIQTGRLAHAYLFCGSRGVGKTTCARIFAKTINCANPTAEGDPCNECPSCRAFNENRSLNITELDAASNNSVDDIRSLTDQVQIPPVDGRYRVFIVDEVHMLSSAAFNAFLKTLEEPPAHAIFILATTEKHKIIPTILSRCQIYDFKRITIADIIDHLEYVAKSEGMTAERQALGVIARKADGAMRDALSIFDQVAASSRGTITYQSAIDNLNILDERYYTRLVEDFRTGNIPDALLTYKEIRDRGFDSFFFLGGLAGFLRDLMVARDPQTVQLLDTDNETRQAMVNLAAQLPPQFFYAAMSLCNDADMDYRTASSKTFLIELLLIKLCQLQSPSPDSNAGKGEGHQLKPIQPATPAAQPAPAAPASNIPSGHPSGAAPAQPAAAPQASVSQPAGSSSVSVPAGYSAAGAPAGHFSGGSPAGHPAGSAPAVPRTSFGAAPAIPPRTTVAEAGAEAKAPVRSAGSAAAAAKPRSANHVSMRGAFAPKQAAGPAAAAATIDPSTLRATPFTDDQLLAVWNQYIEMNPKAHVLCNTMRAALPSRKAPESPELRMIVANQPQVDFMEQELPGLLTYLRNTLANDHIRVSVEVNNDPNAPAAWNDRDLLRHIVESNPHAASFIADFNLTIS